MSLNQALSAKLLLPIIPIGIVAYAFTLLLDNLLHLCPEMQAVTKMANLTKFRQTDVGQSDDFYANYITRDEVNILANLTNLAIFMQITS